MAHLLIVYTVTQCCRVNRARQHPELKESDIPHRTTIHTHIEEVVEEHLKQLQADMEVNCFFFALIN